MKAVFFNPSQEKNTAPLFFFTGWGMDIHPFEKLLKKIERPVVFFYDYSDLTLPDIAQKNLTSISLVGWSMGVWAAAKAFPLLKQRYPLISLTRATAINGTLTPIHLRNGIAPSVFALTLKTLSETSLRTFWSRMCSSEGFIEFSQTPPRRHFDDIQNELQAIGAANQENDDIPDNIFTHALIGENDQIFRSAAQQRAWQKENILIAQKDGAHWECDLFTKALTEELF